ncbi:MAG: GNAT family N-acetyltransferase [Hyphomicrobiales bacterium]|nr:GNAT family N-acetyltransferase [Hyphomicrobiales bacterium]
MSDTPLPDIVLASKRLNLRPFKPEDASETFAAITPGVTRFMSWEPPATSEAFAEVWRAWLPAITAGTDLHLVIRLRSNGEFFGLVGLHGIDDPAPELGVWIKETAHGHGYGREAVKTVIAWASPRFDIGHFVWPVAEANLPSRRLAEALNGAIDGSASRTKFTAAIYRIPAP